MALELGSIEPSKDLVEKGVWRPFGNPDENAKLKIGYARGKEFQRKVAKLTNEAMKQTKGRRLEPDVVRNVNRRAMVGTLLLDFEGFTVDGGKALPRETLKDLEASLLRLLSNDLVYEFVQEEASDLSIFQEEGTAAAKAESKSRPALEPSLG
jgi:hypothetical protein